MIVEIPDLPAAAGRPYEVAFLRSEEWGEIVFSVTFLLESASGERWEMMRYFRMPDVNPETAARAFAEEHGIPPLPFWRRVLVCLAQAMGVRAPEPQRNPVRSPFGRMDEEAMQ